MGNPKESGIIILIEDEVYLRKLFLKILRQENLNVLEAPNPMEGLKLIRETDWKVLLLDIMLPGQNGLQILEEIQKNNLKKGKVVMLTNLDIESTIKTAFQLGADGYLIKASISPENLASEVRAFLD